MAKYERTYHNRKFTALNEFLQPILENGLDWTSFSYFSPIVVFLVVAVVVDVE